MASQQGIPQVKDGCHEHHQQPESNSQCQQLQLEWGQEPGYRRTSLADLPEPCFSMLITEMPPSQRLALFRTCKAVAAAVVQHSTRLTLTPHKSLQHSSSRRTFVLRLAANSSNICLQTREAFGTHQGGHIVPLAVAEMWPCIKRLKLDDVGIGADVISGLHLQQLTQIHTIEFVDQRWHVYTFGLDVQALRQLVQAGGLASLRTLVCTGCTAAGVLQRLPPVLGDNITQLVIDAGALKEIKGWAALREVECATSGSYWKTSHKEECVRQIFSHPQLRKAVVPSCLFSAAPGSSDIRRKLELLELSDDSGVYLRSLLHMPLHAVMELRFKAGVYTLTDLTEGNIQHLQQCSKVQVMPGNWGCFNRNFASSSIATTRPHGVCVLSQFCLSGCCPNLPRNREFLKCTTACWAESTWTSCVLFRQAFTHW